MHTGMQRKPCTGQEHTQRSYELQLGRRRRERFKVLDFKEREEIIECVYTQTRWAGPIPLSIFRRKKFLNKDVIPSQ